MASNLLSISPRRIAQSLQAVAAVFALTIIMQLIGSKLLGEGVIALLYLVPIGWCTVRWGQVAGVSAALTAALSFDFLFIPPYGTFTIGSIEGWLLLFFFSAAAILVVGRIQTILLDSKNRERNATFLYEMVAAIASQQTRTGIGETIANLIQQRYMADLVQVYFDKREMSTAIVSKAANGTENPSRGKPDRKLPILSGPSLIGEIAIWKGDIPLPYEEDPMIQTLLRQIAAALDRAQTAEENATARA